MDDLVEREGKLVLGALAVGGPKMKTHKACVRRLFERNDLVLNIDGVYAVAQESV
jgi:methylenetetrahydrofolate/methylenetetrahydromethanopterin dehydrogenase (NADP+)